MHNSENITSRWPEESKITKKWTDKTEHATSLQRYNTSPPIAKIKSEKCLGKNGNAYEGGKKREDSGQSEISLLKQKMQKTDRHIQKSKPSKKPPLEVRERQ
jgi:hypothetical protein